MIKSRVEKEKKNATTNERKKNYIVNLFLYPIDTTDKVKCHFLSASSVSVFLFFSSQKIIININNILRFLGIPPKSDKSNSMISWKIVYISPSSKVYEGKYIQKGGRTWYVTVRQFVRWRQRDFFLYYKGFKGYIEVVEIKWVIFFRYDWNEFFDMKAILIYFYGSEDMFTCWFFKRRFEFGLAVISRDKSGNFLTFLRQ